MTTIYRFEYNGEPLSYYKTLRRTKYGGCYLTTEGKKFRMNVYKVITEQMKKYNLDNPLENELYMNIKFYHNNKRKNDIDNSLKSFLDCLNKVLFIDDTQVVKITASKYQDKENPRITFTIEDFKELEEEIL